MDKKVGIIYIATDNVLNKSYIGQTTLTLEERKKYHHEASKQLMLNDTKGFLFGKIIRFIGFENFSWRILEENIPINELNSKEEYYIKKYDTFLNGYNSSRGGNLSYNSVLTEDIVDSIRKDILDDKTNNLQLICDKYCTKYDIDPSTISDINCGSTWYNEKYSYPLKKTLSSRRHFTDIELNSIISDIQNNIAFSEISKKYSCSVTTIGKINNGVGIYRKNNIEYPIIKTFSQLDISIKTNIIRELLETSLSQKDIAEKLHVTRKNVNNINSGKYSKEIKKAFPKLLFPLRDPNNINYNKSYFNVYSNP
jgi:Trp operon repressor